MADITIIKPHDEGKSALEVTVNDKKYVIPRGEKTSVPAYVAAEVRRSIALRDDLGLADIDEREDTGGGGGGSNVETATIEITVTDGTPTITSGAFPDWFTAANNDYISGKVTCPDYPKDGSPDLRTVVYEIQEAEGQEVEGLVGAVSLGFAYDSDAGQTKVELDFGIMEGAIMMMDENGPVGSGTYTITLKYIPEA